MTNAKIHRLLTETAPEIDAGEALDEYREVVLEWLAQAHISGNRTPSGDPVSLIVWCDDTIGFVLMFAVPDGEFDETLRGHLRELSGATFSYEFRNDVPATSQPGALWLTALVASDRLSDPGELERQSDGLVDSVTLQAKLGAWEKFSTVDPTPFVISHCYVVHFAS